MVDYSNIVNIVCEKTIEYSLVSHLSAALRREGIDSNKLFTRDLYTRTNSRFGDQNHAVYVLVVCKRVLLSVFYEISHYIEDNKRRNNDQGVVPKFYLVDPLTRCSFGWFNGWREYKAMPSVLQSRKLTDSELVEEIVRDVYGNIYSAERVGIYSRLLEIENLIYKQPGDIRSIGIWGMPGIGKTTLAKAVFEHMFTDYDACCFIENFDEAFQKEGVHRLFEERIGIILKEKFDIKSSYIKRLSLHRDKLCDKMILVVLDDVRDSLAAESFLKRLDWFGPGSLIIVTSIDKQVFSFCQINQIYKVEGLNEHEALQLFSQNAFGNFLLEQHDRELSMKVIDYVNGNPLALINYGRELVGKMSEMEPALFELKKCPPQKMQDVLKNVFSALDDNEMNIVLDIAFLFKGESVNYVVQLLEGCSYFPRVGIDVLVDKCVLTISENTVQMNNMIQDICLNGEIESCTRIWEPNRIRYLLEDDELKASGESSATPKCGLVAENIESIIVDTLNLKFDVKHDAFKNMVNLKFLKIYISCSNYVPRLNFPNGLDSLPCELRLLHWEYYPLRSLPHDFDFEHLVEIRMPYSRIQIFRARTNNLKMLKRIMLCHSQELYEFYLPLYAKNIEIIDLQGCTRLQSFPDTSELQHLRVVNLSGCTEIKSFRGAPLNIEELHLQGTRIRELPISIVTQSPQVKVDRKKLLNLLENFSDVEHFDLENVANLVKISSYDQGFGKLVHLNMKDCSHLQSLPDMVNLESLQVLLLSGCSELEEIKGFPKNLRKLYLGGKAIREVPQLPKCLEILNAHGCKHLKTIHMDFEHLPRHYIFSNCFNLSSQVTAVFLEKCLSRVASLAREKQQELIKAPEVSICIPADARQRSCFDFQAGPSAMIDLVPSGEPLLGFAISVVVSFEDDYHNVVGLGIRCKCLWKTWDQLDRISERFYQCWAPREAPKVEWDHIFVFYDTKMHLSDSDENTPIISAKFEIQTVSWENKLLFGDNCKVTECSVQVITATRESTSLSGTMGESEAIEEHPPTSSRDQEAHIISHSFNEPPKVSSSKGKLRSKGAMLWKWVGRLPLVRSIR